jgi:hypothetical protein
MALQPPLISGVTPAVSATDIALRPTIEVVFGGQSLIDPLTWGSSSFALYGPGDVVLDTGPGTILNSGIGDYPYPLLDGPLRRDRCLGSFDLLISGTSGLATAESVMGGAGNFTLARFTPSAPLLPNTEYTAVVMGDDAGTYLNATDRRFPGVTSYTSPSGFIQSGVLPGITSGFIEVINPYNKTLQTNQYNPSTGLNDVYTITITSGSSLSGPLLGKGFKYTWSQASSPGTYSAETSGTSDVHAFGDGLKVKFNNTFALGEVHELNTYIPKPLELSVVWKFSTGEIESFSTPPVESSVMSVVIDETSNGGYGVDTTIVDSERMYVVSTIPENLDYAVIQNIPYLALEFNKPFASGLHDPLKVSVSTTPLLGLGVEPEAFGSTAITPSQLETSGNWLFIWM